VGEGLRFYPWSLIRYDSWCVGLTSNLMVLRKIWDKFPELFYKITKFPERSEASWQKLAGVGIFAHIWDNKSCERLVKDPISYSESHFLQCNMSEKKMHRGSP
jgi:hypothetical protein